jgi:protein-tyrosine phosphatase
LVEGTMLATDVHCHLLPGLDHGSRNRAESMIMAKALARLGVETVHVTPHQFRWDIDLTPDDVRARTEALQAQLTEAGIALTLAPGAEHYYSERLFDAVEGGEELLTWTRPVAEGPSELLLVELPAADPVVGVGRLASRLAERGIVPVMAHPERIHVVQHDPLRAARWIDEGWLLQLDLMSLASTYGRPARRVARWLLAEGHYAFAGSDLHRPSQLRDLERAHAAFRAQAPLETDA